MAENSKPEPEGEPAEGVSMGKKPTGKPRRKAAASEADAPTVETAVPGRVAAEPKTKSGKQITISLAVVGKVLAGAVVVALLGAVIFFGVNWKSDRAELDAAADAKKASD